MDEVTFGEWLSRRRKLLGLTQKQLAEKINCATITVRKIEAEQRQPSVQTIRRLSQILEIPPEQWNEFLHFALGSSRSKLYFVNTENPWHKSTVFHSFLPASLTSLIGREKEIAAIEQYIRDDSIRLVTIIGSPGIGKTRLATEVAHDLLPYFSGMVGFINLAMIEVPQQIELFILQSIGFDRIDGKSPLEQLIKYIGDTRMLLVLDDFEHLIDYGSQIIHELLQSCPQLKIIVTSREALRITGEQVFPVPPLNIPSKIQLQFMNTETASRYPALRLFSERAHAVRAGFRLAPSNIHEIAEICRKLDGIPLAIELLAARMNIMTPNTLLSHLNEQLVLFTKRIAQMPAYHESLYQAIDWSYRFLSADEQNLLNHLAVFSGGFTIEEIEESFIDMPYYDHVTDLLDSLVEKSLIQIEVNQFDEQRFSLLTIIQQFTSQKLAASGEETIAHQRHLDCFLRLSKSAHQGILQNQIDKWLKTIEVEQNNFRSALNWCISTQKTRSAIFLLTILGWFWSLRGNSAETECWIGMLQSLPDYHEQLKASNELTGLLDVLKVGLKTPEHMNIDITGL